MKKILIINGHPNKEVERLGKEQKLTIIRKVRMT